MLIVFASLALVVPALCFATRSKEMPMDRDVILRLRRFAEEVRREQLLPYE